jgi:hypothetical protein
MFCPLALPGTMRRTLPKPAAACSGERPRSLWLGRAPLHIRKTHYTIHPTIHLTRFLLAHSKVEVGSSGAEIARQKLRRAIGVMPGGNARQRLYIEQRLQSWFAHYTSHTIPAPTGSSDYQSGFSLALRV